VAGGPEYSVGGGLGFFFHRLQCRSIFSNCGRFLDKSYYPHCAAAPRAFERVNFVCQLYQDSPGHAASSTKRRIRFRHTGLLIRFRTLLFLKTPLLVRVRVPTVAARIIFSPSLPVASHHYVLSETAASGRHIGSLRHCRASCFPRLCAA